MGEIPFDDPASWKKNVIKKDAESDINYKISDIGNTKPDCSTNLKANPIVIRITQLRLRLVLVV